MNKKIFSYGPYLAYRTLQEEKYLLNKYKDYLDDIYISPLIRENNRYFIARTNDWEALKGREDTLIKDQNELIDYAKTLGINIDLTINTGPVNAAKEILFNYIAKINPTEICCLDEYLDLFKNNFPSIKYMRSYLNSLSTKPIIDEQLYSIYILRPFQLWENTLDNSKASYRFMANMCCPFNCNRFGCTHHMSYPDQEKYCINILEKRLFRFRSFEEFLAIHTFINFDTNRLIEQNPYNYTIKLSTRIINHNLYRLEKYLDFIFSDTNFKDFMQTDSKTSDNYLFDNFRYISVFPSGTPFLKRRPDLLINFNYDKFYAAKNKLWNSVLQS